MGNVGTLYNQLHLLGHFHFLQHFPVFSLQNPEFVMKNLTSLVFKNMVYLNLCKNMCVLQIWYVSLNLCTKTFQSKHHSTAEMQGCTVGPRLHMSLQRSSPPVVPGTTVNIPRQNEGPVVMLRSVRIVRKTAKTANPKL